MKRIAIFASGRGSNAKKIIDHFESHPTVEISLIVSNKSKAAVLSLADDRQIPKLVIERQQFYQTKVYLADLQNYKIDFIVLAGFLWLIPSYLVDHFPNKIVNIHPALLPKFGGKGMYGSKVHQAVWEAQEKESGITIHYVNEEYDEGAIVFQTKCTLDETDTPDSIAKKVLQLEHRYFPKVIEEILLK